MTGKTKHKVRIIKVYDRDCYDCGGETILDANSDWQEISSNELQLLRNYIHIFNKDNRNLYERLVVIEEVTSREEVTGYIKDIVEFIKKQKQKEELKKKKEEEAKNARKEKQRQNKIAQAKKLLEEEGEI